MSARITERETLHDGWTKLLRVTVREAGTEYRREIEDHGNGASVLPYDPAATVRREAMEETGLRLGELEPVATAWSTPGISCERMSLFLSPCSAADRVGEGGGLADEHEEIEVVELPLAELWRLVESGGIADMKTLVLAYALRFRHPDLFD